MYTSCEHLHHVRDATVWHIARHAACGCFWLRCVMRCVSSGRYMLSTGGTPQRPITRSGPPAHLPNSSPAPSLSWAKVHAVDGAHARYVTVGSCVYVKVMTKGDAQCHAMRCCVIINACSGWAPMVERQYTAGFVSAVHFLSTSRFAPPASCSTAAQSLQTVLELGSNLKAVWMKQQENTVTIIRLAVVIRCVFW
jgi:hypothetical protein